MTCPICEISTPQDFLCQVHYMMYKDVMKEPWMRALRNDVQRERRSRIKDWPILVSLEKIEENRTDG